MVAAAGLLGAVAREEGPVLGTPVVEPEAVLGDDELSEFLEASIAPCFAVLREFGRFEIQLACKRVSDECMAAGIELDAIIGEAFIGFFVQCAE